MSQLISFKSLIIRINKIISFIITNISSKIDSKGIGVGFQIYFQIVHWSRTKRKNIKNVISKKYFYKYSGPCSGVCHVQVSSLFTNNYSY